MNTQAVIEIVDKNKKKKGNLKILKIYQKSNCLISCIQEFYIELNRNGYLFLSNLQHRFINKTISESQRHLLRKRKDKKQLKMASIDFIF